jgi:hypothetical protein
MSLIKKPEQLEEKTILKGLIYGVPGGGKTTLALSAPRPLLIDIDRGLQRVNARFRADSIQAKTYGEVEAVFSEDLSAYDTIVIDTLGKLVDLIGDHVQKDNPAYKQSDGTLTMKGWGAVSSVFKNKIFRPLEEKEKNLIFVCHEREEKDGDLRFIRPDIAGSTKNNIVKELDFMGYLEVLGKGKRIVHFSPTAKFYAKNSIGISDFLELPNLEGGNTFMTDVIFKTAIEARKKETAQKQNYDLLIKDLTDIINTNPVNMALEAIQKAGHIWDSKLKAWNLLTEKAKAAGLAYDKETKAFEKAAPAGVKA